MFDLEQEANIPTWFTSLLLLSVSISSFANYILSHVAKTVSNLNFFWIVLSSIFMLLSLDESSGIHELFGAEFKIKWIWIYGPLAVFFLFYFATFLEFKSKNKELVNFILGGFTVYILGGLSSEIFDSYLYLDKFKNAIEEGFEMIGALIILTGCLKEINQILNMKYLKN
ncbi:MAG: hypothetical protein KA807_14900 [Prolixibacteraceae bacterium]|nr:hypothetical protein [Prolixibacteraceae bacterium]